MPHSQAATLELALRRAGDARRPRAPPCRIPLAWSASPDWKLDFQNIAQMSPEEIARRRAEFDKQKAVAKGMREDVGVQRGQRRKEKAA